MGLVLALAAGCNGGHGVDADENPEPKPNVEKFSLKSMRVSFEQEGIPSVLRGDRGKAADHFDTYNAKVRSEVSDVFLVRGEAIDDAAGATGEAIEAGLPADRPVPRRGAQGRPYWLVALLGRAGSSPPAWQVESARRTGKVVRLTVSMPPRKGSSQNLHLYVVWVPLGKLADGDYSLELHDKADEQPSLVRRVAVKDEDE